MSSEQFSDLMEWEALSASLTFLSGKRAMHPDIPWRKMQFVSPNAEVIKTGSPFLACSRITSNASGIVWVQGAQVPDLARLIHHEARRSIVVEEKYPLNWSENECLNALKVNHDVTKV